MTFKLQNNMLLHLTIDSNKSNDSSIGKPSWVSKSKHTYTPLGDSLELVLNTLISNKIITLPYNYKPYEPKVTPKFWNDNHYCIYDRKKDHKTKNYGVEILTYIHKYVFNKVRG